MIDPCMRNSHIVLIDDEQTELDAYSFLLESMGIEQITTISDSRQAMDILAAIQAPIVFLDLNMPHLSGRKVLRQIKTRFPQAPVIILTANSEIETAVECLKLGAHDYLVKPINMATFSSALRTACEIGSLRLEVMSLKGISFAEGAAHPAFAEMITCDPAMRAIFGYVETISTSLQPALILGETGSGKELIAKAIHQVSGLPGDFIAVDVSGLDDALLSDTLFGHAKGAYTGADKARAGLIEKAQGGTLFLDEIGDLSEQSQVKLLRLLQEGVYYPLGSDLPKQSRARIVTATNKELAASVGQSGGFRMDLYFRLCTHLIKLPPLRQRQQDIPMLVAHFLREAAVSMKKSVPSLSREALQLLKHHPYYGNIRELKTYLYDAVARSHGGKIPVEVIAERLSITASGEVAAPTKLSIEQLFGRFPSLDEITEYGINKALESTGNNQSQAAKLLGISKQALHKRLKKRQQMMRK